MKFRAVGVAVFQRVSLIVVVEFGEADCNCSYPWDNRRVLNYFGLLCVECFRRIGRAPAHSLSGHALLVSAHCFKLRSTKWGILLLKLWAANQSYWTDILPFDQDILNMCDTLNSCTRPLISKQFLFAPFVHFKLSDFHKSHSTQSLLFWPITHLIAVKHLSSDALGLHSAVVKYLNNFLNYALSLCRYLSQWLIKPC